MPSLVVIGAQWGDEGKGKVVDFLTSHADWVVRFQGGNNAGHTLVVNGVKTKLSLVPSGILRAHAKCLIGAGVVLNPKVFAEELLVLKGAQVDVSPSRLVVDRDAHLILEYHVAIDLAREEKRGKDKLGTTGRGIGPAYEDRASRVGVRVGELQYLERLKEKLSLILEEKNSYLKHVLKSNHEVSFDTLWAQVLSAKDSLLPYIGNVSVILDKALKNDDKVVFEGAQGTLLDQTFGTVPFVTSSSTLAGAVTTGCGIGPKTIDHVLGIAKAYSTRVGSGPFPTELKDSFGDRMREAGAEFGTVTGRPRRCGWFDAFALKRAVRLNGVDSLVMTKLDVLTGIKPLKVCTGYKLDGKILEDVPSLAEEIDRVEPQLLEFSGWDEQLGTTSSYEALPKGAREYVLALSKLVECPVSIVSVGAERGATIFCEDGGFVRKFVA